MSKVCRVLDVTRSNLHQRITRPADWADRRRHRTPADDGVLVAQIRAEIGELPTYGYRRACALVNRAKRSTNAPPVNAKRVYRVMAANSLLLPKAPKRRQSAREHDGVVSVSASNTRWCSDGFEISCDSGETVTGAFTKDCCDRKIIAWRAWRGKGLPGEPVREMLIEAVEKRFGNIDAIPHDHRIEFLADNGGAYRAIDTHSIAHQLGLKPIHTPVYSPQSNGIAESFVNTLKRDYVSQMDLTDALTVLRQLPKAFMHFNEIHPHSSLKTKSPREFRRQLTSTQTAPKPELNCV